MGCSTAPGWSIIGCRARTEVLVVPRHGRSIVDVELDVVIRASALTLVTHNSSSRQRPLTFPRSTDTRPEVAPATRKDVAVLRGEAQRRAAHINQPSIRYHLEKRQLALLRSP